MASCAACKCQLSAGAALRNASETHIHFPRHCSGAEGSAAGMKSSGSRWYWGLTGGAVVWPFAASAGLPVFLQRSRQEGAREELPVRDEEGPSLRP